LRCIAFEELTLIVHPTNQGNSKKSIHEQGGPGKGVQIDYSPITDRQNQGI
jgi:hypothetical protein